MKFCVVRVEFIISEPWGVGAVATTGEASLPILLDVRDGTPYLPATSLVGALRSHLNSHLGDTECIELLGQPFASAEEPASGREIRALGTCVSGTRASGTRALGEGNGVVTHDTTRISPETRAADSGSLRREQVVAASAANPTTVVWFLEYPGSSNDQLLDALACWHPFVGRRRSVGRGAARVRQVDQVEVDLNAEEDLGWWLDQRHQWFTGAEPKLRSLRTWQGVDNTGGLDGVFSLDFEVMDALHLGTGEPEQSAQTRKTKRALVLRNADDNPIIPGTSWKGVFRSRAQFISELVGDSDDSGSWDRRIARLFGESSDDDLGGTRGCLRFSDSEFQKTKLSERTHVSIDRFTGGALGGGLFTEEVIPFGSRSQLVIKAEAPLDDWDRRLLSWVVKDLHDGLIGVGGRTTRGFGTIQFDEPPAAIPISSGVQDEQQEGGPR